MATVPRLRVIELALSNVCNMSPPCVTCFSQHMMGQQDKTFASPEVVGKIMNYIPGIDKLFLGGLGEPMMHPLFLKLVASGNGKVAFLSNGLLLDRKNIPLLVGNTLGVTFSLDAASSKMYALMRKDEGAFVKIISNIKNMVKLRGNCKTPVINLSFVISKANLGEMCDFVTLASSIGADAATFTTLNTAFTANYNMNKDGYNWNYQEEIICSDNGRLRDLTMRAVDRGKQLGVTVKTNSGYSYIAERYTDYTDISAPADFYLKGACVRPWGAFFIKPNGDVTLCCHTYRHRLGNILEDDLGDLMSNSEILNAVRAQLQDRELPPFCKDCFWVPENIKDKGFRYKIETSGLNFIQESNIFLLKGNVRNTGEYKWENEFITEDQSYKIGGRVFRYGDEKAALMELRFLFKDKSVAPGETCDFQIEIPVNDLRPGIYLLKVDVVKERCFWFEDKGENPPRIKFDITPRHNPHASKCKIEERLLKAEGILTYFKDWHINESAKAYLAYHCRRYEFLFKKINPLISGFQESLNELPSILDIGPHFQTVLLRSALPDIIINSL
ncbi:MAG: radical SAM protein, partial [Candidatus Omnitrophota bacterium]|nr:radical SAM protein [Candidatus Omnitrophota bacterium]